MSEPTEMQMMEMEMVQGMYDSYELITNAPPQYSVLLAPTPDDDPELKVTITYPSELYPEEAPCEVLLENIAKNRRIQTASISNSVKDLCNENIGMHSVILILQHVQEFLTDLAEEEEKKELQRRGDALNAAAAPVAADPTVRLGTAVTKELFAEWSRKHHAEKEKLAREEAKKEQKVSVSALTGRQLWDNTLRAAEWDLFDANNDKDAADEGEDDVDYDLRNDELNEDNYDFDDE